MAARTQLTAAQQALVVEHLGRAERRAHDTRFRWLSWEDRLSAAQWGLCLAAQVYDGRCPFEPFADLIMRRAIRGESRRQRRRPLEFVDAWTMSLFVVDRKRSFVEIADLKLDAEPIQARFGILTDFQAAVLTRWLDGWSKADLDREYRCNARDLCYRAIARLRGEQSKEVKSKRRALARLRDAV